MSLPLEVNLTDNSWVKVATGKTGIIFSVTDTISVHMGGSTAPQATDGGVSFKYSDSPYKGDYLGAAGGHMWVRSPHAVVSYFHW